MIQLPDDAISTGYKQTGPVYFFKAKDYSGARHWVINHLDLSYDCTVVQVIK